MLALTEGMTFDKKLRKMQFGAAPAVVLVNPQLGENIGMAARAMANFSLSDLRLVSPREGIDMERAVTASAGAVETVEAATTHETLEEALAKFNYVYATTARPRDMTKEVMTPEQASSDMHARIDRGEKVAILFGRERWGLSNDEVSKADMIISAPVNPDYASLNIAQAVLLVGYEWYKSTATSLGMATQELEAHSGPGLKMTGTQPASKDQIYGFYDHIESELSDAGFFKTKEKQPLVMRSFRNMFARALLTEQEVKTLRGMVSSLTRKHLRGRKTDE